MRVINAVLFVAVFGLSLPLQAFPVRAVKKYAGIVLSTEKAGILLNKLQRKIDKAKKAGKNKRVKKLKKNLKELNQSIEDNYKNHGIAPPTGRYGKII